MVYWRDTRRAVGPQGFKLLHTQLRDNPDKQQGILLVPAPRAVIYIYTGVEACQLSG